MGHKIEVYETHDKLGGMLRYGIPNYRFPKDRLDEDIRAILSAGDIEVKYEAKVGTEISMLHTTQQSEKIFLSKIFTRNMMQFLLELVLRQVRHFVLKVLTPEMLYLL